PLLAATARRSRSTPRPSASTSPTSTRAGRPNWGSRLRSTPTPTTSRTSITWSSGWALRGAPGSRRRPYSTPGLSPGCSNGREARGGWAREPGPAASRVLAAAGRQAGRGLGCRLGYSLAYADRPRQLLDPAPRADVRLRRRRFVALARCPAGWYAKHQ